MKIENLILMQDGLRLPRGEIFRMKYHVETGGKFVSCDKPIAIVDFGDSLFYLRDGLHRCASIYLGRPDKFLYENEYVIENMTYEKYMEINWSVDYYTPFDPRTEVRIADLTFYRNMVKKQRSLYERAKNLFEWDEKVLHSILNKFVMANRNLYTRERIPDKHNSIRYYAEQIGEEYDN